MLPPPGWYPCPSGAPQSRYWDGAQWTGHVLRYERDDITPPVPPQRPFPHAVVVDDDEFADFASSATGFMPARRRRHPDLSVFSSIPPLFVLFVVSLLCVDPAAQLLALPLHTTATTLENVWLWGWVPLLFRPVERLIGGWFFGARKPTADEKRIVEPCWHAVLKRAGRDPKRFLLFLVDDLEEPNASAGAGHVVTVTTAALSLPAEELSALLAHELGHHLGWHPVVNVIKYYFELPIRAWRAASTAMMRAMAVAAEVGAVMGSGLFALFGLLIAFSFKINEAIFRGVANLLALVLTFGGRRTEYVADAAAVRLGYGVELRRALLRFVGAGYDMPSYTPLRTRLTSTHPPLHERIARIEERLRRTRRRSAQ